MPILITVRSGPLGTELELVQDNKSMVALVTAADGVLACNTAIAGTPSYDCCVAVFVNGQQVGVTLTAGDNNKPCYFSADGGVTPKAMSAVALGDLLYWRGSVAGYQLDANDLIDFIYQA